MKNELIFYKQQSAVVERDTREGCQRAATAIGRSFFVSVFPISFSRSSSRLDPGLDVDLRSGKGPNSSHSEHSFRSGFNF